MKKCQILKKLNDKLADFKKIRDIVQEKRINQDGTVNLAMCIEWNDINTNIRLTIRKIEFVRQGKGYLGEEFSLNNNNSKQID